MAFNNYPYTDAHQINLDWVISKTVEVLESDKTLREAIQQNSSDIEQLKIRIANMYSDPAYQQAVYDALDEMLDNGTLANLVQDIVTKSNNIIDSSLNSIVEMPDDNTIATLSASLYNMTANDIYALYDTIPDLTKNIYTTTDALGNDLVYYTYESPGYQNMYNSASTNALEGLLRSLNGLPYLFITTGVHGDEKGSVLATYLFIKEMFRDPNKYGIFNSAGLTVIPVVNPSGFNANTRYNSAGIDINRNFNGGGYSSSVPHAGNSVADQPETQFVQTVMKRCSDTWGSGLFVVDAHQFLKTNGDQPENQIVFWYNCASDNANYPDIRFNLYKTVAWLRPQILTKFPYLTPDENDTVHPADKFNTFVQPALEATCTSYATYTLGASGFLCESMSETYENGVWVQYSANSIWLNFFILANSIYSTFPNFKPSSRRRMTSLSEIGLNSTYSLTAILNKLPYKCDMEVEVEATGGNTGLAAALPSVLNKVYTDANNVTKKTISMVQIFNPSLNSKVVLAYGIANLNEAGEDDPATVPPVTPVFVKTFRQTYDNNNNPTGFTVTHDWIAMTQPGSQLLKKGGTIAELSEWMGLCPVFSTYVTTRHEIRPPAEGAMLCVANPSTNYYRRGFMLLYAFDNTAGSYKLYLRAINYGTATLNPDGWQEVSFA